MYKSEVFSSKLETTLRLTTLLLKASEVPKYLVPKCQPYIRYLITKQNKISFNFYCIDESMVLNDSSLYIQLNPSFFFFHSQYGALLRVAIEDTVVEPTIFDF